MNPAQGLDFDGRITRDGFEVSLEFKVDCGEVAAILGPNGSGKSTLLEGIAGLVRLANGRCQLQGRTLEDTGSGQRMEPHERHIGYVFQNYRLFPMLSVLDNIAFAARVTGTGKTQARAGAREWLERLDLTALADRRPHQLSGGEGQRVAVARALATTPALLLLDEPMAALDASTAALVQRELAERLEGFDGPTVLVTHNPIEAMTLAKRVLILESGAVVQVGSPSEIAARPATEYVAQLVGLNLLRGRRSGTEIELSDGALLHTLSGPTAQVLVAIRPSSVVVSREQTHTSARNTWPATVRSIAILGDRVRLDLDGTPALLADVTLASLAELQLQPGARVWVAVKATDIEIY